VSVGLANGSIGPGTGRVVVRFRSISGQSCSGRVRVKLRFESLLGQSCSGRVRVRVRVEFGSGMFPVVCGSPVRIGYGSSLIWVGWDSV